MPPFQRLLDAHSLSERMAALWNEWCVVVAHGDAARREGDHERAEAAALAARGVALVGASLVAQTSDDLAPKVMWLAYYRDADRTPSLTWVMIAAAIRRDERRLQPPLVEGA